MAYMGAAPNTDSPPPATMEPARKERTDKMRNSLIRECQCFTKSVDYDFLKKRL